MLKTKSIILPRELLDGVRISVMSRHTLNDGITPHPNIKEDSYDEWLRALAPPLILIGSYYKRNLPWDKFESRYLQYLRDSAMPEVISLAQRSLESTITIMCIEDSPERCHRRLLAEECKRYNPYLLLDIK